MHMAQPTLALLLIGLPLTLTIPHTGVAAERPTSNDGVVWVYVGTYTKTPDAGINFLAFDLATGKLTQPVVVAPTPNPSFLALNRRKPVLYAINEVSELAGRPGGVVRAYAVQPKSGQLAILNQQYSGGPGPCHVNVDQTGRTVLVANYSGGSVASFPLRPDGSLAPAATIDHHHGSSVNPSRQTGPFAHCVEVDPANRFVLSADLGIDKVMIYRLDAATGSLAPNQPANVDTARGAGPRHIAFHPNGQFVFVVNELDSTIGVFRYDGAQGRLQAVQRVSTLPRGFAGASTAAEIQVHPSGRFLYASNRGHDSIAIFAVDPGTGTLRCLGHQSTFGKSPRHFAIDPSGHYLLAANQEGGNVVVFRIDSQSGMLQPTGVSATIPMPVCIVMMRPVE